MLYLTLLIVALGPFCAILGPLLIRPKTSRHIIATGRVSSMRALTKRQVQFELDNAPPTYRLTVSEAWVIKKGDVVSVGGTRNADGTVEATAYRNHSADVRGAAYVGSYLGTTVLLTFGSWALAGGLLTAVFESWEGAVIAVIGAFMLLLGVGHTVTVKDAAMIRKSVHGMRRPDR